MVNAKISHASIRLAHQKGYRVLECGALTNPKGKRMNPWPKDGYLRFSVKHPDLGSKPVMVHRLQAFQKFGEQIFDPLLEVRHLNNNSLDNSYDNIAIGTRQQNAMDKTPETRLRCAINASKKAQKHDHAAILSFYQICGSYGKTMQKFGITSKGTLHFILNDSCGVNLPERSPI